MNPVEKILILLTTDFFADKAGFGQIGGHESCAFIAEGRVRRREREREREKKPERKREERDIERAKRDEMEGQRASGFETNEERAQGQLFRATKHEDSLSMKQCSDIGMPCCILAFRPLTPPAWELNSSTSWKMYESTKLSLWLTFCRDISDIH